MADTLDLGSSAAKHKGSSPLLPTNRNEAQEQHSDANGQSQAANLAHLTGISSVGSERCADNAKVLGSNPRCPTNDTISETHLGYTTQQI